MTDRDLYAVLAQLEIPYEEFSHPAVYTCAEAHALERKIPGTECKNLLLADRRGDRFFLVILAAEKRADIKAISQLTGVPHLRFASVEQLDVVLHLIPGSVTPMGIIHDTEHRVTLLIDRDLENQQLQCHPNTNTRTIVLAYKDLLRFLAHENHTWLLFEAP